MAKLQKYFEQFHDSIRTDFDANGHKKALPNRGVFLLLSVIVIVKCIIIRDSSVIAFW